MWKLSSEEIVTELSEVIKKNLLAPITSPHIITFSYKKNPAFFINFESFNLLNSPDRYGNTHWILM